MALYDDLQGLLNRGRGSYGTKDQVTRMIAEAESRASSEGRTITGYRPFTYQYGGGRGGVRTDRFEVPLFSMTEEERLAPLRAEQERILAEQRESFAAQQADIAEQMKILRLETDKLNQIQTTQEQAPDPVAGVTQEQVDAQLGSLRESLGSFGTPIDGLRRQLDGNNYLNPERRRVVGVKAARSPGFETSAARRTATSQFNRTGMRISSLNI